MRAIVIEKFGDPGRMSLVDVPEPTPLADQILIRTEAIGVGGVDAVIRRGTLGSAFPEGMVPGSEVAGTVIGVGRDEDAALVGQRVWAFTGTSGGYAEQVLTQRCDTVILPEELSSVDAVTLVSAATVAHFALAHAHLVAGESVLVRGAAGSIGIATIEIAARSGARVIAVTTSSAERGERLIEFGVTHVLDRAGMNGAEMPMLFDVIIDIAGGADVPLFLDRLAPNGRLVLVGAVAGYPPSDFGMRMMQSFQQSRSFATFSLASVPVEARDAVRAEQFRAATHGELHPVVHAVMPLADAAEAHRQMDLGTVIGRIVLIP